MAKPRPLRCAVVPPAPAPYREPLFRALDAGEGLELRVIYQSPGQPSWDVDPDWFGSAHAYPAERLNSWQLARPGRTPIMWPRGLERALKSFDPDCVVVWEYGPASLRVLRWCRRHRRAYVVFTECTPQIDAMLSPPRLWLHRWIARHADGMIAASSAARDRLLRLGARREAIAMALQSADLEGLRTHSRRASDGTRPLTVLSVGRLVPDKNFATLLEAYTLAGLTPEQARVVIVGTGLIEEQLRQLADRLGVPAVFRGHVTPGQLAELYADADIFALVSTYEPFGVAVREAAAAGLPIICSRLAGAAGDVAIDGRNAFLVDPNRVEEVSAALKRLAQDPALRTRMAAQSRAIDAETDGKDVEAFTSVVTGVVQRRERCTGR